MRAAAQGAAVKWVNPVRKTLRSGVKIFKPTDDVQRIVTVICDLGWKGQGVHVFLWRCGTVVVVRAGSASDAPMHKAYSRAHFATYARAANGGPGPLRKDVIDDLRWAMSA